MRATRGCDARLGWTCRGYAPAVGGQPPRYHRIGGSVMLGRTHALSGAVVFLAAAPVVARWGDVSAVELAVGSVAAAGAATAPDLDHPDASPARSLGPPTWLLATGVAAAIGGHRNGTHSLLGLTVATGAAAAAGVWGGAVVAGVVATVLVGFALAAAGGVPTPGRVAAAAGCGCTAAIYAPELVLGPVMLPLAVAAGYTAHLAGDCLTAPGCPLAWPASHRTAGVGLVDTGGLREKLLVTPVLAVAAVGLGLAAFGPWPHLSELPATLPLPLS